MLLEIMYTTEGGDLLTVKDVRLVAGQSLLGCADVVRRRAVRYLQIVKEEKLSAVGAWESQLRSSKGEQHRFDLPLCPNRCSMQIGIYKAT